ncbi:MAG: glycosyltransferase [Gammaproteobacteria bacterium]|nr:glycosyltransferase [Gammaproteobacteria bacterium]
MHILHTESSLGWGGQEIRILTEAEGMLARGHTVTLLCPRESTIYHEAISRGVAVVALPIARKSPQGLYAIVQWLKNHRVSIVNTHSSTDSWLVALAACLLRNPPPIIRTRHISAAIPDNAPTRWLYTKASRHIVTTGEALRQQLIAVNGYSSGRITSIPTGIDTGRFVPGDRMKARRKLGLVENVFLIGIVATLRSWKGHCYLIEAFAKLADEHTWLVIVGDGPQREALKKQIAERDLDDRIIMAGNQHDVLPWLQAMDIFVLPSYANEGVPQALVQAMLCALPVITTSVGSIQEAVQHEQTGLIVEPKNPQALAGAMERLLSDASLRQRLGEAARRYAQERFGLTAMLDKMEAIFTEVGDA